MIDNQNLVKKLAVWGSVLIVVIAGLTYGFYAFKQQTSLKAATDKEQRYEQAINFLKLGRWAESKELLADLEDYKDAGVLSRYADAQDLMARMTGTEKEYKTISGIVDNIPAAYNGEFRGDIDRIRKYVQAGNQENSAGTDQETADQLAKENARIQISVELIEDGRYEEAQQSLPSVTSEVGNALYWYAKALKDYNPSDWSLSESDIYHISPDYNAVLSQEIRQFVSGKLHVPKRLWESGYSKIK